VRRKYAILLFCFLAAYFVAYAQTRSLWRQPEYRITTQPVNDPKTTDGIKVYSQSGNLIIQTPEKTTVKVLSILGQTISQATVNPGIYELPIGTHGIYIVKIGAFTIRVAI